MLAGEVDPRSSMQRVSSDSRVLISWARLLERRVSLAPWAAAESCAVLFVEPKNFMKLCATHAAGKRWASGSFARCRVSRGESGGQELLAFTRVRFHGHRGTPGGACCRGRTGGRCRPGPICLRHILLNINLALEVCPLFDGYPLRGDIAYGDGGLGQFGALRSADVSIQLTLHNHALGIYIGPDLSMRSDDQTIARQLDASLHLAIHVEVLTSREFPLDDDRLAYMRKLCRLGRFHDCGLLGPFTTPDVHGKPKSPVTCQGQKSQKGNPVTLCERHSCFIELYPTTMT